MKSHRIVVIKRGGPEVLQPVEEDAPQPQAGEVRIAVSAAGVSAYDLLTRSLNMPGNPRPPFTPGEDIVGVVDQVGDGVTGVELGQRVAAWTYGDGGGYAESVCRPADRVAPVPDGLDDAAAVALVVNYLTAHIYLHKTAEVQSGERMLIHGAAGGLGTAFLHLGKLAGLEMYGTASEYNHELVSSLGATPIDYRTEDFVERIRALTGDGVDVVYDPIGGASQLRRSYRTLRKGGRLIPVGSIATQADGRTSIVSSMAAIGMLKVLPDGKSVRISPNMMKYPFEHVDWYRETLAELLALGASGAVQPEIADRIPLLEARRAHELLERGGYAGKVVLVTGA